MPKMMDKYKCPACGHVQEHPSMLRSIPHCENRRPLKKSNWGGRLFKCGYPMKRIDNDQTQKTGD